MRSQELATHKPWSLGICACLLVAFTAGGTVQASPQGANLERERKLTISPEAVTQYRILRQAKPEPISPTHNTVTVKPNELLVQKFTRPPKVIQTSNDKAEWELPYELKGVTSDGAPLNLRPLVRVDGGGLRPAGRGAGFRTQLYLTIQDLDNPNEPKPLPEPISVLVTAAVDSVEPGMVKISHTNGFSSVQLAAADPSDPVQVHVTPSFDATGGTDLDLKVLRGTLHLEIAPRTIEGFALQTGIVTVRGTGFPGIEGTKVTLNSPKGTLDPVVVSLGAGGEATAKLRSIGIGTTVITANALGFTTARSQPVSFEIPVVFIICAAAGGLVGALIGRARAKRKGATVRSALFDLFIGVLTGSVVAAAFAIGIHLIPYEPVAQAGEAVVFVLSALGALFGIPAK